MTGDLPLTATHWGTYRAEVRGAKLTALHPFEHDPDPSPIGAGMVGLLDAPSRIKGPAIRRGWLDNGPGPSDRRGAEPFVEVSWDEAERLVADELTRIVETHGNNAIYGGSYGWSSAGRFHHAQSQLHRFLNSIGGYTRSVNTYSFAAAEVIVPHVLGTYRPYLERTTSWRSIAQAGQLFVAFGGLPLKNGQINTGGTGAHTQRDGMAQAARAGVEFVSISPLRSDTEDMLGAEWIAPLPGTDTAILLALAQVLAVEGLADLDFLDRYCVGYDRFRAYLTGETDGTPKTPEWAGAISQVPADTIRGLARRMAAQRTMISVSWSLTRQDHGEQPFWAAIALAAMLGQIGLPGGGIGFGYTAVNGIGADFTALPFASLPQGANPVPDFIPVARVSDMLLNPGGSFAYDGGTYRYPDIRCVYWAGGNPFHHHQDINRMLRAWSRPDTVVIHDWCWNAAARHADIVLPCTTTLERSDLGMGGRDDWIVAMRQALPPQAHARDDYAIFSGIAGRMGRAEAFTEGRTAEDWQRWIYDLTRQRCAEIGITLPGLEELRDRGYHRVDPPAEPLVMLRDFRADPDAHPLRTPSGRIEIFSETIAGFGLPDCPGHPAWLEPREWLGAGAREYPLHLISNQPATKLHSQLDHGAHARAAKIAAREPLRLHPDDAAARGIGDGDVLRVFNARGACLAGAVLDTSIRPGVVQMATGAWYDPAEPGKPGSLCKHGSVNVLTRDQGTSSLAQGPSAVSCLVDVERLEAEPPPVTAFDPPEIAGR